MADIIQLDPHENMTPEECLAHCALDAESFRDVLIIGFDTDGELMVRSSHMSPRDAVWLLLAAVDYARDNRNG